MGDSSDHSSRVGGTAVRLITPPLDANAFSGTYNGVFFDVRAHEDAPILVTAISATSTRGCVRVFAARKSHSQVETMTDWRGWVPVGCADFVPRADQNSSSDVAFRVGAAPTDTFMIPLDPPVPIEAGSVRGFHVHLSFPEGSRLQTREVLEPGALLVKDKAAEVIAGVGYIGYCPFFTQQADGIIDGRWRDGRAFVGSVEYELADGAVEPAYAKARAEFEAQLSSLHDMQPFIGPVNRQLVTEWHGDSCDPPLLTLALPAANPQLTPFTPEAVAESSGSDPLSADSEVNSSTLDTLWGRHDACKHLWLRFLSDFHGGADAWVASVRALCDPVIRSTQVPCSHRLALPAL